MDNQEHTTSQLDARMKVSKGGVEYWLARHLQELLEYADWDNFVNVVKKAAVACATAGINPENHFREVTDKVEIGSGATGKRRNYFLSRYACYLIAMNGNSSKGPIALAQTYFAVQARRQEIRDTESEEEQRVELRERLRRATKDLNSCAKKSGVQNYGLFHDAGYRGLYGMSLSSVKAKKGLQKKDDLFDRAGKSELAANFFKTTQAAERLEREKIQGEEAAKNTHLKVGGEVRATIRKLGNTMPENLPAEPHIKVVQKKIAQGKKLPLTDISISSDSDTKVD